MDSAGNLNSIEANDDVSGETEMNNIKEDRDGKVNAKTTSSLTGDKESSINPPPHSKWLQTCQLMPLLM